VEGVDYIFLTVEEFEQGIREGMFLEYAKVYGNYYGTPKDQVLKNEEEGYDSLLVIDVQGAMTIKRNFPRQRARVLASSIHRGAQKEAFNQGLRARKPPRALTHCGVGNLLCKTL
jgi:guanylate kinase